MASGAGHLSGSRQGSIAEDFLAQQRCCTEGNGRGRCRYGSHCGAAAAAAGQKQQTEQGCAGAAQRRKMSCDG
ncbi:hypothetical protein IMCC9480_156 [Oxalobacteraceae bacterium IMCC9480]|nr:hypothetical protein IMCC9480_156 [Oxalobacteraceae bacterium IMCC9480]